MIIRELLVKLGFIVESKDADQFDRRTDASGAKAGEEADRIVAAAERATEAIRKREGETAEAYRDRMTLQRAAIQAANKEAREQAKAERIKERAARQSAREQIKAAREAAQAARQAAREQEKAAKDAARAQTREAKDAARAQMKAARETVQAARQAAREQVKAAREATQAARAHTRDVTQSQRELVGKLKGFGLAIGATFASMAGSMAIAKSAFDDQLASMREIDKRRASIQATREEYQQLGYVAMRSGIDVDNFHESMVTLGQKAFDAFKFGSEAGDTLALIGLSASDAQGNLKPTIQLMLEMADAIAAMPDGTEKTFILDDIFGDPGALLVPVMNQGSDAIRKMMGEAEAAGAVFDSSLIDRSLKAGRSMDSLRISLANVRAAILDKLIPVIQPLVERLTAWLNEGDNIERLLNRLSQAAKIFGLALGAVGIGKFIALAKSARSTLSLMTGASGFMGLAKGLIGMAGGVGFVVPLIAGLVALLADLVVWATTGESALSGFAEGGKDAGGIIGAVARALIAAKEVVASVLNSEAFQSFLGEVVSAVTQVFNAVITVLGAVAPPLGKILSVVMTLAGWVLRFASFWAALILKVGLTKTLLPILGLLAEGIAAIGGIVDWLFSLFSEFFAFVGDGIENLANAVTDVVNDVGELFGASPRATIKVARPASRQSSVSTNVGGITVNVGGTNASAQDIGREVEGASNRWTMDAERRQAAAELL